MLRSWVQMKALLLPLVILLGGAATADAQPRLLTTADDWIHRSSNGVRIDG